jgi:hypothetical protein
MAQRSGNVYVDRNGTMRWGDTKKEVQGFGVNYTVPFAHAYRAAKKLGVPIRKAIDDDVYHFSRLGFDAYRVHVWDTEISDTVGNLLPNEHLDLFDYMVGKMKERGMKFILTPIAYWGNGYPERDEETPGFSRKYGKDACLTDDGAIRAQENYLFQFLNHVNPYTGIAYKDDPSIIAFEVSNEPHHREEPGKVTAFISRMVKSMHKTGCRKPIFYNVSHSIHLVDAYYKSGIQGGTFQWYPTGLGAGHELGGNLLPNVDLYHIPFADKPAFKKGAKIVYEFDAADVGRSYIYPAMARSFRKAGIQWATHFSYDPTYMAYANTEYNTHFMNLAYAPQKGLSLKLAAEVFRTIPMYADFGSHPANTKFGPFRVSYEKDLAEMMTDEKFIYTNHTTSAPASPDRLTEVAGFGNSPVVKYEGQGAYFLDRLESGVWRLEVMPDAIWVKDPFGRNSLDKVNAVINWAEWPMTINLPDLGGGFTLAPMNEGNDFRPAVKDGSFRIVPGAYLITRSGVTTGLKGDSRWKNILLKEFVAPPATVNRTYVLHEPISEQTQGEAVVLEATIVSNEEVESVDVSVAGTGWRPQVVAMKKREGYKYVATIPAEEVNAGFLRYYITVNRKGGSITFPSGTEGRPGNWDFYDSEPYEVRVIPGGEPVYLFVASRDQHGLSRQFSRRSRAVPMADPERLELRVHVEELSRVDPENPEGERLHDYSMRFFFGDRIKGRQKDVRAATSIVFRGRSGVDWDCPVQIALITKQGVAYGGMITLGKECSDYSIPVSALKKVDLVTLPRPYPTFLSYYFKGGDGGGGGFDLADVESLQVSIGPGISSDNLEDSIEIGIESIRLE